MFFGKLDLSLHIYLKAFFANAASATVTVNCQVANKLNPILEAMQEEQECRTYPISKMLRIGSLFSLFIIEIKRQLIAPMTIQKPSYAYSMALNIRKALKENACKIQLEVWRQHTPYWNPVDAGALH